MASQVIQANSWVSGSSSFKEIDLADLRHI